MHVAYYFGANFQTYVSKKLTNKKLGNIDSGPTTLSLEFVQMKPKFTLILIDLYLQGGGGGSRIRLLRMFAPEQIRMLGPTTEPLYIVVRMINIFFIGYNQS